MSREKPDVSHDETGRDKKKQQTKNIITEDIYIYILHTKL